LETFRQLAPNGGSSELEALRKKLQDKRDRLEKRQAEMEASLQSQFKQWDLLQGLPPLSSQAREEKNSLLHDMQEILSHRTYVRNMVNDLLETTG